MGMGVPLILGPLETEASVLWALLSDLIFAYFTEVYIFQFHFYPAA